MAACPLAFIIPSLTYIKAMRSERIFCRQNARALAVLAFGIFAMVTGVVTMIINYATVSECSHGTEMQYCLQQDLNGTTYPA